MVREVPQPKHNYQTSDDLDVSGENVSKSFKLTLKTLGMLAVSHGSKLGLVMSLFTFLQGIWDGWLKPKPK